MIIAFKKYQFFKYFVTHPGSLWSRYKFTLTENSLHWCRTGRYGIKRGLEAKLYEATRSVVMRLMPHFWPRGRGLNEERLIISAAVNLVPR